ncbi:major facilitator superfamily transporter [Colletotrichum zoysiae]|uniref:Major facilitator superfamily transporter n=1 Tax=Colletotrichum zoysiae TaxID=1216348 RepID=A0AAD9M0K2_9PEZI|nr:major facilitator superfamily transporter [Colletotrichum zoysiae]
MQSYLQYRRMGRAVERELKRLPGGTALSTTSPATRAAASTPQSQSRGTTTKESGSHDPEKLLPDSSAPTSLLANEDAPSVNPIQSSVNVPDSGNRVRKGDNIELVGWDGPDDPEKPRNWKLSKRLACTIQISIIATALACAAGIDAAVLPQAAEDFGVSQVAESLSTGMYLIGQGIGCLVAGPFSETFGRNIVYTGSMVIFIFWILACALAPNFGAHITFRLLAGCAASAPLTCCGGSVSDMFNPLEKTWAFPIYAINAFGGPMLGAIMGAYIGPSTVVSWRWAEWTMLILSGLVLVCILLFMPETYEPVLLSWKAKHLRQATGDDRYHSEHEVGNITLFNRLKVSMTRPFVMATEPIIFAITVYLSLIYIVIFTFLVSWPWIFEYPYQIGQGLSNVIFISMFIGLQLVYIIIPVIYKMTSKDIKSALSEGGQFKPEIRLWYGMLGASCAIPVSLFWIGATARPDVSIWSPILAVALFGYGIMGVFICIYMYVIDCYESYSASALTLAAFVRYCCAGAMTVAGIPLYTNMGTDHALYLLGGISALLAPIPFVFFKWGNLLRERSKYAFSFR